MTIAGIQKQAHEDGWCEARCPYCRILIQQEREQIERGRAIVKQIRAMKVNKNAE